MQKAARIFTMVLIMCLTGSGYGQGGLDAPEALWLKHCAISPDGKTIVFAYQGDLHRVSVEGGEAVPVTLHEGYDCRPVWSPDGKWIVFSSRRYGNFDLFVIPSNGGEPRRLTHHSADDWAQDWSRDGKTILFTSPRDKDAEFADMPGERFPELYEVGVEGGLPVRLMNHGVESAKYSPDGKHIVYTDIKSGENKWRKRQRAPNCTDLWLWERARNVYRRLTIFEGDDRLPLWSSDGKSIFFVSDRNGRCNLWKIDVGGKEDGITAVTGHQDGDMRYPSVSSDGNVFVYSLDGKIWTLNAGAGIHLAIRVAVPRDEKHNNVNPAVFSGEASEFQLSPTGEEIAFVAHGEVFCVSADGGKARRLTQTSEQERSVSWSPDGKKIVFAAERGNIWGLYTVEKAREKDAHFYEAMALVEKSLLVTQDELLQPVWSPTGEYIAFLKNRETLSVWDVKAGAEKVVCEDMGYSYIDGDLSFTWSPDGKWLAYTHMPKGSWNGEIAVASPVDGETHNVTRNGYEDGGPRWSPDGKQLYFISDREGLRPHGSWGAEYHVFSMFLNKKDYDDFQLEKIARKEGKKKKPGKDEKKEKGEDKDKPEKEKTSDVDKKKIPPEVKIDFDGIEDRIYRLTMNPGTAGWGGFSPDGESFIYYANSDGKYSLWVTKPYGEETKKLADLNLDTAGDVQWGADGKRVYFTAAGGTVAWLDPDNGNRTAVPFTAKMEIDTAGELNYFFDHCWRQMKQKFYREDLHGVDWSAMRERYKRFLPQITEKEDFAELMSEMLGEVNASHTGCYYRPTFENPDDTGYLGLMFDEAYRGAGLLIREVVKFGPCDKAEANIQPGEYVLSIDGKPVGNGMEYFPLLNRKVSEDVLLVVGKTFDDNSPRDVVVKPIARRSYFGLLYKRRVERNEKAVEKASDGKLGYVHVAGMSQGPFRKTFADTLGKFYDKKGLIVDTRHNGGGWLHDDLCVFLSGKTYCYFRPRGKDLGAEPQFRWKNPSIVIVSESNYSDASFFPYSYRALGIGKTVGMPVPGTATAVWWERLHDGALTFGIPEVGVVDMKGDYLENQTFTPDYVVPPQPGDLAKGIDAQLLKAVEELLKEAEKK